MPVYETYEIVDAIIDLIKKNISARTNVVSDVSSGDTTIFVENTFHFNENEEVVFVDFGYNVPGSTHYNQFEYAKIKNIINTTAITLYTNTISNWLVSDNAFVQKTIGHTPLYANNIYFGDREVIPDAEMAVTVEPVDNSNEWIYIRGGLSEEYNVRIMIYGMDVSTEDGMIILTKYTDRIRRLLIEDNHPDINDVTEPLKVTVAANSTSVVIADTPRNRENFEVGIYYELQDNNHVKQYVNVTNVVADGVNLTLTINEGPTVDIKTEDFGVIRKQRRYLYDSRASSARYGTIQKGSAKLRAAEINWFGKETTNIRFPAFKKRGDYFPENT